MPIGVMRTRWWYDLRFRTRQAATWFGMRRDPDGSPVERARSVARLIVGSTFVLCCLVAIGVGEHAYHRQLTIDRADAQHGYRVTGTVISVLSDTTSAAGMFMSDSWDVSSHTAVVGWLDRTGREHRDSFWVDSAAVDQGRLNLWIDARGRASTSRHTQADSVADSVFAVVDLILVAGAAAGAGYAIVTQRLKRRRRPVDPDLEWLLVEPHWRRRYLTRRR